MNKNYLVPIKNEFLVYQPGSEIVYRGKKETAELKDILVIPFITAIATPVLNSIAIYIWPFLYISGYRAIIYTTLMIISGVVYYKFIYVKNKEKLLQLQLETVKLIDIKKQLLKINIKLLVLAVLLIAGLFSLCLYNLIYVGNGDKILYSGSVIMYTVFIPCFTIESAIKNRFLLIKHLLKLKK